MSVDDWMRAAFMLVGLMAVANWHRAAEQKDKPESVLFMAITIVCCIAANYHPAP